jgi:opacity protein-like surface antigen
VELLVKTFFSIILSLLFFSSNYSQSNFAVGVNAGLSLPVGQLTEFYQSGYGGNGQFMYSFSENFMVILTIGYDIWDVDQDALNKKLEDQNKTFRLDINSHFRIIPFYIGARYYITKGKHRPFFSFDFGGYSYEFKLTGDVVNTIPEADIPRVPIADQIETGTESALALGLGYFHKLSKHWYLEIHSKYNVITNAFTINEPDQVYDPEDPTSIYGVKGDLAFFTFMAGINYRF